MKYWQARKLFSQKFKRLYGVFKKTFQLMVRLIKAQEKCKKKSGRPFKIIIENQVLIALQYWREYLTYYHIAKDWNIAESTGSRIVKKVENILIKSRKFRLPVRKELRDSGFEGNLIVMDVMESPIEKPSEYQKIFKSGKQKEHSLKSQIIIEQTSQRILCIAHSKGKTHDFKLFKNSGVKFNSR